MPSSHYQNRNHYYDDDDELESAVPKNDPTMGEAIRRMEWDDRRISNVLFQCYGSVWPQVLPYCIVNVLLTIGIQYLHTQKGIDITMASSTGHKYMAALMSFLVVTRVKIIYDRYMLNSTQLANAGYAIRQLAHYTCLLTARDSSPKAKQWRHDVLYHAIVLLRVTSAILQYQSNPQKDNQPWNVPELSLTLQAQLKECMFLQTSTTTQETSKKKKKYSKQKQKLTGVSTLAHRHQDRDDRAHTKVERTVLEESCRAVNLLCFLTRREIMKQRDDTWFVDRTRVWDANEEAKLLDCVGDFQKAFASLRVMFTTPMPFPLVQMTKTFLFVWVFRIPFVLCGDDYDISSLCIIVFLITFGFFGLEFVAMELADTFGNDPSDFDDLGQAQLVFEDCYIAIMKCDDANANDDVDSNHGYYWAHKLRQSVMGRQKELQDYYRYYGYGDDDDFSSSTDSEEVVRKQVEFKKQEELHYLEEMAASVDEESRASSKKKKSRVARFFRKMLK